MMKLSIAFWLCTLVLHCSPTAAQAQDVEPNFQVDAGEDFGFDTEGLEDFDTQEFQVDNMDPAAAVMATGMLVLIGIMALLGVLVLILVAYLLSDALTAVPEQLREIPSWVPWLLLIPLVQIVVLVLAFIKVPKSLSNTLASMGDTSMGDCGESNGLWGSILYLIPCTFPVGLVLLVMSMLKINQAKKIVRGTATTGQL